MDVPDHARVAAGLPDPPAGATWPVGWTVRHVAVTGSTNADLLEAADSGAPDRSVLVTDHQTTGRGRLARTWTAPPATNLLVSMLFRDPPDDATDLTRRIGLAAVDATRRTAGLTATLKWPNDVMVDDRKLAGILAQRAASGVVVVGIGLNVGWAPDGAVRLADGPNDPAPAPLAVLYALLGALDGLPVDITDRYRDALGTLGRRVRVELPERDLVGRALDVEADGRLVVLDDCAITHRVSVGDVVHLRPADDPG